MSFINLVAIYWNNQVLHNSCPVYPLATLWAREVAGALYRKARWHPPGNK